MYVLCYDAYSRRHAEVTFAGLPCALVIEIEQTFLFEGVMYQRTLREREHEWADADFVGTVAWSFSAKRPLGVLTRALALANPEHHDFVNLFPSRTAALVGHTPETAQCFVDMMRTCQLPPPPAGTAFCMANYWMATPALMREYLTFFEQSWMPALQSHPHAMANAGYSGKLTKDQLIDLAGVPYYPVAPFVNERVVAVWMAAQDARTLVP